MPNRITESYKVLEKLLKIMPKDKKLEKCLDKQIKALDEVREEERKMINQPEAGVDNKYSLEKLKKKKDRAI